MIEKEYMDQIEKEKSNKKDRRSRPSKGANVSDQPSTSKAASAKKSTPAKSTPKNSSKRKSEATPVTTKSKKGK